MVLEPWVMLPATAGLSLVLCLLLTPIAHRFDLLDHPNYRKVHQSSIPLVGGFAIFIALTIAVFLATPYGPEALPLMLACALMLLTGVLDDLHELSAKIRFMMQILACCIMIFAGGVVLTDFGSLMWNGVLYLGWF